MGDGKWVKMVENGQHRVTILMCHIPNAWEAKNTPGMEPKTCQKGPKVGFEYLPTSKTSCAAFPLFAWAASAVASHQGQREKSRKIVAPSPQQNKSLGI